MGAPVSLNMYFSIAVAIIFPPVFPVLGVAQDMQYEYFLSPMVDVRNQPAPVVTDIKNNASSDAIYIIPTLFHSREMFPLGRFGNPIPCRQRCFPLAVRRGGYSNLLATDNSHNQSSHIAKSPSSKDFCAFSNATLQPSASLRDSRSGFMFGVGLGVGFVLGFGLIEAVDERVEGLQKRFDQGRLVAVGVDASWEHQTCGLGRSLR